MERNKAFCEECRKDVEYTLETVLMRGNLKGEEYEYYGEKAVCVDCHSEVYVAEVEDKNLRLLYDAYRQKNGIVSLEKILEISQRYNIGKRPLSLLLGWGEMTLSRYCDGDMPTKQYSEILQRIYDDPRCYRTLLETNKENLKSQQVTKKAKGR